MASVAKCWRQNPQISRSRGVVLSLAMGMEWDANGTEVIGMELNGNHTIIPARLYGSVLPGI